MARAFHRTFIAAVSAGAIFVTAFGAAQVEARDRGPEAAIAALLGLAVVGAIIANKRDEDRKSHVITRNSSDHGLQLRPLPHRAHRDLLPQECLRMVRNDRGGDMRVFGGRCLRQNDSFADSLPRNCAQSLHGARGGGGHATVWNAHCLQRNGYRISRR